MEEDEEGVCHPALLSEGLRRSWDTTEEVRGGTPGSWLLQMAWCLC